MSLRLGKVAHYIDFDSVVVTQRHHFSQIRFGYHFLTNNYEETTHNARTKELHSMWKELWNLLVCSWRWQHQWLRGMWRDNKSNLILSRHKTEGHINADDIPSLSQRRWQHGHESLCGSSRNHKCKNFKEVLSELKGSKQCWIYSIFYGAYSDCCP